MTKGRILVVEADDTIREHVVKMLKIDGHEVQEAASCRVAIQSFEASRPDALVVAGRLPDGSALEILAHVKRADAEVACVVLAKYEELDVAVQAIQEGAEQFLTKPVQLAAFLLVVDRVLENQRNRRRRLRDEARAARGEIDPFLGESPAIRLLHERAQRVAGANVPVLIRGETGTGKGVLAAWIHRHGPRAEECFLDLNCAGLSPEFLESELFGHEKGAFTSAVATKLGLLEVAHRGTLFLDEIGDVPLSVQPKLLKVLEEKKFRRLGDVRERQVDIRLIAASHARLDDLVEKKEFRADLYFRINTVVLEIPPLRDRPDDLTSLAELLLGQIVLDLDREPMRLAPAALEKLHAHRWPGNVRELRNALERAVLLSQGQVIGPEDFSFEPAPSTLAPTAGDGSLLETEKDLIRKTLEKERGRIARAAESLGISRSSLYQKVRKYGIVVSRN
ncbi:MAG TPA: sigma-54 dependent transcriptional regulator [Thermoanaerobaculia bacterium]|nr:sigma-54 dependent transcriptional regulator [Thermoanaerobaculia bacterium]